MDEAGKQEHIIYDGVMPVLERRMHPLAAIYRKCVAQVMERQILSGNYKIRDAFEKMHILYVDVTENENFARMLRNVTTMEEYKMLSVIDVQ